MKLSNLLIFTMHSFEEKFLKFLAAQCIQLWSDAQFVSSGTDGILGLLPLSQTLSCFKILVPIITGLSTWKWFPEACIKIPLHNSNRICFYLFQSCRKFSSCQMLTDNKKKHLWETWCYEKSYWSIAKPTMFICHCDKLSDFLSIKLSVIFQCPIWIKLLINFINHTSTCYEICWIVWDPNNSWEV